MSGPVAMGDPAAAAGDGRSLRQRWMAVLARASASQLEAIVERMGGLPDHTLLKPAETGTVMVEARAGGGGRRFNMGEATMTRCVVRLPHGATGFAYALGTDRRKARICAVLDALLQDPEGGRHSTMQKWRRWLPFNSLRESLRHARRRRQRLNSLRWSGGMTDGGFERHRRARPGICRSRL